MSSITYPGGTTGQTLYAELFDANGLVYNTATLLYEAYAAANFAQYGLALAEQGTSAVYAGTIPAQAATALSSFVIRQRAGGTAAVTDVQVGAGGNAVPDVQAGLTAQGYTTARAATLDAAAMQADVAAALTAQGLTTALTTVLNRLVVDNNGNVQASVNTYTNAFVAALGVALGGSLVLGPHALDNVAFPSDVTSVAQAKSGLPYALRALLDLAFDAHTQSATGQLQYKNDAGAVLATSTVSDDGQTVTVSTAT